MPILSPCSDLPLQLNMNQASLVKQEVIKLCG